MKAIRIRQLITCTLCGALSLSAFGQRQYTLDECRELALRNNVAVRNAANSVEAARQERKEAFTKYFPTVSASGAAFNADKGLLEMEMSPEMRMSLAQYIGREGEEVDVADADREPAPERGLLPGRNHHDERPAGRADPVPPEP